MVLNSAVEHAIFDGAVVLNSAVEHAIFDGAVVLNNAVEGAAQNAAAVVDDLSVESATLHGNAVADEQLALYGRTVGDFAEIDLRIRQEQEITVFRVAEDVLPAFTLASGLSAVGCGGVAIGHGEGFMNDRVVQHDVFFFFGSKRVATIRIRAGQAAVIDSAVDVVKFVKAAELCKPYNKCGSSGKIVGFTTRKDIRGVRKGGVKCTIVYFGQFVVVSNALRRG